MYIGERQRQNLAYYAAKELPKDFTEEELQAKARELKKYNVDADLIAAQSEGIHKKEDSFAAVSTFRDTAKVQRQVFAITPAGRKITFLEGAPIKLEAGTRRVSQQRFTLQGEPQIITGRKPEERISEVPTVLFSEKAYALAKQRELESTKTPVLQGINKLEAGRQFYQEGTLPLYGGRVAIVKQDTFNQQIAEVRLAEPPSIMERIRFKEVRDPGFGAVAFPAAVGIGFGKGLIAPFRPSTYKNIISTIKDPHGAFSELGTQLMQSPGATLGEIYGYSKGFGTTTNIIKKVVVAKTTKIDIRTGAELRTIKDVKSGTVTVIKDTAFKGTQGLFRKKRIVGAGRGIVTVGKEGQMAGGFQFEVKLLRGTKLLKSIKSEVAIKGIIKSKPGGVAGVSISKILIPGKLTKSLVPSIGVVRAEQYLGGTELGFISKAGILGRGFGGKIIDTSRQFGITRKLFTIEKEGEIPFDIYRTFGKQLSTKSVKKVLKRKDFPVSQVLAIGGIPLSIQIPKPTPKLRPEPIIGEEFRRGIKRTARGLDDSKIRLIPLTARLSATRAKPISRARLKTQPITKSRRIPVSILEAATIPDIDTRQRLLPNVIVDQRAGTKPLQLQKLKLGHVFDFNIPPVIPPPIILSTPPIIPLLKPGMDQRRRTRLPRKIKIPRGVYNPSLVGVQERRRRSRRDFLTGIEVRGIPI